MKRKELRGAYRVRSESEWRKLAVAYEKSGLSVATFCDRHDIAHSTFRLWKRRLEQGGGLQPSVTRFAEYSVESCPERLIEWGAEFELPSGVVLRVSERASSERVRTLLKIAGEG